MAKTFNIRHLASLMSTPAYPIVALRGEFRRRFSDSNAAYGDFRTAT